MDNGDVTEGKLFIVNQQQRCGDGFVQLQLESVGAAFDLTDSNRTGGGAGGGGGATPNGTDGGGGEGTTRTDTPGFGIGVGVAGLLAAAGGYVLRRGD